MICKECGKEIDDDLEFCYFCGADCENGIIKKTTDQELKCPLCGGNLESGIIEAVNCTSLLNTNTVVVFYPEAEKTKFIRKNSASLNIKTKGFHCVKCDKYIGIFDKR